MHLDLVTIKIECAGIHFQSKTRKPSIFQSQVLTEEMLCQSIATLRASAIKV